MGLVGPAKFPHRTMVAGVSNPQPALLHDSNPLADFGLCM